MNSKIKAQDIESLSKQFPGEKAVMLKRIFEYNISLKSDEPYV